MAQTFTVSLSRYQNQPWGFRMQGGKDFSTSLSIAKIQPESIADKVGLQTGDNILKINDINTDTLRHKEAQDVIMRAGNGFELTVQRGGMRTWKPTVTPLNQLRTLPKQDFSSDPPPVIKTSLAANKQDFRPIGSTHNVKARPFNTYEVNGSDRVTALVHKQYNSPAALYSYQNIADTLSKQAEVLTGGVKGVNFMKTDPPVNKESAVYKMVKEEEHCYSPLTVSGGERGTSKVRLMKKVQQPQPSDMIRPDHEVLIRRFVR
jgi:PDZ and LIM domain protein 5/6/7